MAMTTDNTSPVYRPWLHRFAVSLVVMTFLLVLLGGTVTSKGVGLSVPDWPNTYGQNMLLFPPSLWKGGVFWEHTHRLLGAGVGLMTIVITAWVLGAQRHRKWLVWLTVATLLMVIVQGVMGGLRVTELSTSLAVLHGVTAQLFLCMCVLIAAATSQAWVDAARTTGSAIIPTDRFSRMLRRASLVLFGVMVIQLVLGASMRHTESRLAIPDFPSAYGQWMPPLTTATIHSAIDAQPYDQATMYYSSGQVGVHFAHRVWAVAVVAIAVWLVAKLTIEANNHPWLVGPMTALVGLLILQISLGASIIWTGQAAYNNEIATAHQGTGAALLATAALIAIRVHVLRRPPRTPQPHSEEQRHVTPFKGAAAT